MNVSVGVVPLFVRVLVMAKGDTFSVEGFDAGEGGGCAADGVGV